MSRLHDHGLGEVGRLPLLARRTAVRAPSLPLDCASTGCARCLSPGARQSGAWLALLCLCQQSISDEENLGVGYPRADVAHPALHQPTVDKDLVDLYEERTEEAARACVAHWSWLAVVQAGMSITTTNKQRLCSSIWYAS